MGGLDPSRPFEIIFAFTVILHYYIGSVTHMFVMSKITPTNIQRTVYQSGRQTHISIISTQT